MAIQFAGLGQIRPGVTTPVALWTVGIGTEVAATTLKIANNSGGPVVVTLYHDIDGAVFDDDSMIGAPFIVADGQTVTDDSLFASSVVGAAFGIQVDTINAVAFTAMGTVITPNSP